MREFPSDSSDWTWWSKVTLRYLSIFQEHCSRQGIDEFNFVFSFRLKKFLLVNVRAVVERQIGVARFEWNHNSIYHGDLRPLREPCVHCVIEQYKNAKRSKVAQVAKHRYAKRIRCRGEYQYVPTDRIKFFLLIGYMLTTKRMALAALCLVLK